MAKTIMIIEDDVDVRETIEMLLKKNGYDVIAVSSTNYLDKVKTCKLDLILIEGFMSRSSILENLQALRGIKVAYLVTDYKDPGDVELYANVVGFVEEPREIKEFLKKIKKLC